MTYNYIISRVSDDRSWKAPGGSDVTNCADGSVGLPPIDIRSFIKRIEMVSSFAGFHQRGRVAAELVDAGTGKVRLQQEQRAHAKRDRRSGSL